jgi:hypothetical protein
MDEYSVRRLAARWGWTEVQHNVESRVMGFVRGGERVNVYYTTGERSMPDSTAYQRGRSIAQTP